MKLCRYAIITDTVNFSEGAKKATASDEEVIKELDKKLAKSCEERTNDYQLILEAKQDTKKLTVMQCLRKDLKVSLPASDNYSLSWLVLRISCIYNNWVSTSISSISDCQYKRDKSCGRFAYGAGRKACFKAKL